MDLEAREREVYQGVWDTLGERYDAESPGVERIPLFLSLVGGERGIVLDAGCGGGRAGATLASLGFDARLCDITDCGLAPEAVKLPFRRACLWRPLRQQLGYLPGGFVDWVYCCDVLEHVPEPLTMLAVYQLCGVARREVFLVVSFQSDISGYWVGNPLHHTVKPFTWWRDNLGAVTEVLQARDLLHHGVFWLRGFGRQEGSVGAQREGR